jgi:hypothetical protein
MLETVSLKRTETIIASSWIQGSEFDSSDIIATRGMMVTYTSSRFLRHAAE